tara:strand:+ start:133 stop:495 length:363 start_codon:yes stop_codon:yes gene_type:complete
MSIDNYLKKQNSLLVESLNKAFNNLSQIPNTESIIEELSNVNNLSDLKNIYLTFIYQNNILKNNINCKTFVREELKKILEIDIIFLYGKENGKKGINLLHKLENENMEFHKSIMDVIGYC